MRRRNKTCILTYNMYLMPPHNTQFYIQYDGKTDILRPTVSVPNKFDIIKIDTYTEYIQALLRKN